MSVQQEIQRIESAKTSLKTAIEGKGVTVPDGTKLDGYGALVDQIQSGGGVELVKLNVFGEPMSGSTKIYVTGESGVIAVSSLGDYNVTKNGCVILTSNAEASSGLSYIGLAYGATIYQIDGDCSIGVRG